MSATPVDVRQADQDDLGFMKAMLYEAANRPGDDWPPLDESLEEPNNRRFWIGFPRAGDVAVVAEIEGSSVGAAWIRRFSVDELTDNDDPEIPVLVIGVDAQRRGEGVGGMLMSSLVERARAEGVRAIDLTTRDYLKPAVRLYDRTGFRTVGRRGSQLKMRLIVSA